MTYTKILKLSILLLLLTTAFSSNAEIINRVYAVVGQKVVTQYELETLNPKRLQMIYEKFSGDEREEELQKYYMSALNAMIDNYVLEQSASKEGVRVSEKELEAAINDIMERNNVDEAKLRVMLESSNQTLEQYKWSVKIDIIKARLMSTVFRPKIIITDDKIQEYAQKNSAELELSDNYELRMMTVDSEEKLNEALEDFKKNNSFRDTAMKYSTAGNADTGGYLGWLEIAYVSDEIQNAVKGVETGITKPVENNGKYTVYFVESFRKKEDVKGSVKDKIIKTLTAERAKELYDAWLEKSKKNTLIQRKYED